MLKKKAQGISFTAIVYAVIALVVVVVIIALFTGRAGMFSKGAQNVPTCDAACRAAGYSGAGTGAILLGYTDSKGEACQCKPNAG